MRLTYWVASHADPHKSLRAKTKWACEAARHADSNEPDYDPDKVYGPVAKVTVEYANAMDLVWWCLDPPQTEKDAEGPSALVRKELEVSPVPRVDNVVPEPKYRELSPTELAQWEARKKHRQPGGKDYVPPSSYVVYLKGVGPVRSNDGWIRYWSVSEFGGKKARELANGVRDLLNDNPAGKTYEVVLQA